eukprot:gene13348-biopygen21554
MRSFPHRGGSGKAETRVGAATLPPPGCSRGWKGGATERSAGRACTQALRSRTRSTERRKHQNQRNTPHGKGGVRYVWSPEQRDSSGLVQTRLRASLGAYVAKLPDGKAGSGYLRNEMFKYVEEHEIEAIWGGDWNAVSGPAVDRSSAGEWQSTGDRLMKRTMTGQIVESCAGRGRDRKPRVGGGTPARLGNLPRSIGQLGVGIVWDLEGSCAAEGPQIVRASYGAGRKRGWTQGVHRIHEFAEDVALEEWQLGGSRVYAITAPHAVVEWLKGRGVHHLRQLAMEVSGNAPPR